VALLDVRCLRGNQGRRHAWREGRTGRSAEALPMIGAIKTILGRQRSAAVSGDSKRVSARYLSAMTFQQTQAFALAFLLYEHDRGRGVASVRVIYPGGILLLADRLKAGRQRRVWFLRAVA
jgi:hypothetical protein